MPAFIRNLLNRRLMNQLAEGQDLSGDGQAMADELQNDDDFASIEGLDRGDGPGPQTEAPQTAVTPAVDVNLEALKAIAASAADEGAGDEAKPHVGSVPMPRFQEVNERRKQAEAALEAAQAELQAARSKSIPSEALDALEEKYTAAMMDGNTKEAVSIRRQINQHIEEQAVLRIKNEQAQRQAAQASSDFVDSFLSANPWLNTEEGMKVQDILADLVEVRVHRGEPFEKAFQDVANEILPRYAPANSGPPPAVDPRAANSVKRGAQAAAAQAPSMQGGFGNRAMGTAMYDINTISDEDFMKLSEEDKARMRGG
ncbi:hypothetical protein [Comamonas aquatica]|uniref:hypothetical protein n=1 Tax=Comamonas aquatica TaxID=225991 RepID=UPI002448C292|nr:hypothetical protein [Comamonas aquatica]MDH1675827.1 hypothetical protein [Comamonas aquatica]MDH1679501.1 hypothetical protein [Comamonas aquatica]